VTQKGTLRGVAINLRQLSAKAQAMSNDDGFDADPGDLRECLRGHAATLADFAGMVDRLAS
jgi:hypothetical protein